MIIGIVGFHGNAASLSFSIANIVNILGEQGHQVHFFQNRKRGWKNVQPLALHESVHTHYLDLHSETVYEYSGKNLIDIARAAKYIGTKVPKYDLIIGIDQDAVIAALLVKLFLRARKLVYFSMEIILMADYAHKGKYFLLKHYLEKIALKRSEQLWIQDRFRGNALVEDLGCPNFPPTLLPHSPRFLRKHSPKSTYLRDKYHIPPSSSIIIYTGGIDDVYYSRELAEMAAKSHEWPQDAVLVIHGFGGDSIVEHLKSLQNERFIFSNTFLSFEELDELIDSADIGIAPFDTSYDTNHYLMASGKVMNYLKMGIPIITAKSPTTKDVVERHQTGICIDHLEEIPAAYQHILRQYDCYSANAAKAFEAEYEFERNFTRIWRRFIVEEDV